MICSDKTTSICFTAETTELDTPQLPFGKYWHFSCFAQLTRCAHVYNKLKKSRSRDHFLTSSNFTSPLHWEFCTVIQRVVATAKSLSLSFFFLCFKSDTLEPGQENSPGTQPAPVRFSASVSSFPVSPVERAVVKVKSFHDVGHIHGKFCWILFHGDERSPEQHTNSSSSTCSCEKKKISPRNYLAAFIGFYGCVER